MNFILEKAVQKKDQASVATSYLQVLKYRIYRNDLLKFDLYGFGLSGYGLMLECGLTLCFVFFFILVLF